MDLERCTTPRFRKLLKRFLDDLERIGAKHGELYDTDVRERIADAVFMAFVLEKRDYALPAEYGMFSGRGNALVGKAVRKFVDAARKMATESNMNIPAKRLRALEDPTVATRGGEGYDAFLGSSL